MNIEPGLGIGDNRYGITEEELISLMGRPNKVEEMEYVQGMAIGIGSYGTPLDLFISPSTRMTIIGSEQSPLWVQVSLFLAKIYLVFHWTSLESLLPDQPKR